MAEFEPEALGLTTAEVEEARRRAGRDLCEIEWAVLSVLWSEHCAYKHSRHLLSRLPHESPRVLAGPGASAGVLDLGEGWAVAAKIESHNHPSAVEPFQGAATGVGGIMRDVLAMGARPAAFLDSLRFGPAGEGRTDFLLRGVVGGISHYGNCVGVPTVGGDVFFHPSYLRNPLVNAMCVGFLRHGEVRSAAAAGEGSRFLLLGATTGRDGIGGAAFASVTLREDAAQDRPRVQVGDPFFGKLLIEATLEILETTEVIAIQDLGAGGLAGAAIEMCHKGGVGAELLLDRVPLRAQDLLPGEILLSESQERMLLCLGKDAVAAAQAIAKRYGVHAADVGGITGEPTIRLVHSGEVLSELPTGIYAEAPLAPLQPAPPPAQAGSVRDVVPRPREDLLDLLSGPDLADRSAIYATYDQDVGLRTVVRPGLDAAVLRAAPGAPGIAVTSDQTPRYCALSAGVGAELAVCEAARNVLARGARPIGLTNCLNLGSPERPEVARQLEDVVDGIAHAAKELGIPVTGGNVSLYNESGGAAIVPTPVIGMIGGLADPEAAIGVRPVEAGQIVVLLGKPAKTLAGSEYAARKGLGAAAPSSPDYEELRHLCELLPSVASQVALAHDVADGGLLVALAEMALHGGLGLTVSLPQADAAYLFGEPSGEIVLLARDAGAILQRAGELGLAASVLGVATNVRELRVSLDEQPAFAIAFEELEARRAAA